ncbi:MAG: hypothetical protein Q4D44_00260 [Eubacteriales bacterium]|nr:hypothetical protein [Eubacteriales bacterium]
MKKNGKYRFSLQFGSESDEEYRAGEFLEYLGNKKSAVIVAALNEYLVSHPELQSPYCKIEVKVGSNLSQEKMEQIIRAIVDEKMASLQLSGTSDLRTAPVPEALEQDVATMLDNLDLFG